jgi:EmrB/QacA subfamily drug resistance transporter
VTSQVRPAATTALLAVVCAAQFMVILDVAIVNVALPSIDDGLSFSTAGLQWVVNAYTLTFAGFLMLGGRAADLLGRRRVFIAGTALFALASVACALADSRGLLIGARALQGLGGAVVSPATLAIITSSFREGPERNRALGMWGAVGALGASSGALVGGLLTQSFGWPAVFAINAPLGLAIIVIGLRVLPPAVAHDGPRRFDLSGAVLVTAGLVALTFGIVRTETLGWGSPGVLAPLGAGVALLVAFVLVEARLARAPLVPLSIFRRGQLRTANLVVVLLYMAFFPVWFFLTIYLQQVLGYDALTTGVAFLPMTLSIFAASSLAPRVVGRNGARAVIAAGMSVAALGMLLLTRLEPAGGYFGVILVGAVLTSVGMGFSLVPATIVSMQGVERSQSGVASGLLNTSRLVGGALGLAVLSTIAEARTSGDVAVSPAHALTDGFALAFLVGALLCLAGAVVAALLLRPQASAVTAPADAETVAA